MKHHRNIRFLFFISFLLALAGFILDLKERVPDIIENIRDISLMTFMIFIPLLLFYGIYILFFKSRSSDI